MKKLNRILGLVFAVACLVMLLHGREAHADIGAPYVYSYDVIVTNPDGAVATRGGGETAVIPSGTVLTIGYYYTDSNDGEVKMQVMGDESAQYSMFTVKASDVKYVSEKFDMSSVAKTPPLSQYILTDESYLYKGPGERYGRNDDDYHLPAGIVVTSVYHDDLWMYVEYDGHEGWIYHYNVFSKNPKTANVADDERNRSFITTRNKIELRDTPYEDGEVVAIIGVEPLSEIPVLYYFTISKFSSEVYVVYGQYAGWYRKDYGNYDVASSMNQPGITIKETMITDGVESDSVIAKIPANTEISVLYVSSKGYSDRSRAYVRAERVESGVLTGSVEGWIDGSDYAGDVDANYQEKSFDYEQNVFNVVDGESIGTIGAGKYYAIYYFYTPTGDDGQQSRVWYYLSNDAGPIGWVKALTDEEVEAMMAQEEKELEALTTNEEPESHFVYPAVDWTEDAELAVGLIEDTVLWFLVGFVALSAVLVVLAVIVKKVRKDDNAEEGDGDSEDAGISENDGASENVGTSNGGVDDGDESA